MYELLMINVLATMSKAQARYQSHWIMIGVYILAFLWFLAMVWMMHLSDEMDIDGSSPSSHEQRKARIKQSQAKDAKKKHRKQSKIVEPYDTEAFRKDSANFDIDEFWKSYTRKHKKK